MVVVRRVFRGRSVVRSHVLAVGAEIWPARGGIEAAAGPAVAVLVAVADIMSPDRPFFCRSFSFGGRAFRGGFKRRGRRRGLLAFFRLGGGLSDNAAALWLFFRVLLRSVLFFFVHKKWSPIKNKKL